MLPTYSYGQRGYIRPDGRAEDKAVLTDEAGDFQDRTVGSIFLVEVRSWMWRRLALMLWKLYNFQVRYKRYGPHLTQDVH
jgi:hypothetical protein